MSARAAHSADRTIAPGDGGREGDPRSTHAEPVRNASSPLLTKVEAAAFCKISLCSLERFVQPHVRTIAIGNRRFFFREDIQRWLEEQRAGSFSAIPAQRFSSSGSR